MIDYSKAFDVVNHKILLKELSGMVFRWIADFLRGCVQSVICMGIITSALDLYHLGYCSGFWNRADAVCHKCTKTQTLTHLQLIKQIRRWAKFQIIECILNEIYICEAVCDAVREWSEVTRPSADCQTTFLDVSSNQKNIWKKSLNGHATVVGGHATVDWLSNNVFWTFQAIRNFFEKSRWTVTRQWSEVRRPSADCQTTFFWLFKQLENFLKKVAERSRDSGRRSRDCRPTVKQRFFSTFQAIIKFLKKSGWTVTRQWSEVTRPSADCQTTFFGRVKRFGKILKKVAERSRGSGWGHATVGRLSNNVFWTFQAIWKNFEKSRWTVTQQWSKVTRPSADCQTTFFRFKQLENFLKSRWTVTRQWLRSRDRRSTVKQRFLDVSSN